MIRRRSIEGFDPPYSVILADPPWQYAQFTSPLNGAAAGHYDTMTAEAIGEIPVAQWADKNSALFLWGTWPCVGEAIHVMKAWGFEQIAGVPWIKTFPPKGEVKRGIGFWTAGVSEYVLIGKRGTPKRKKIDVLGLINGESGKEAFYAPIGSHSAKPIRFTTWVEEIFPKAKRLELFARRERQGWTTLGRKLGHDLGPWGVRAYEAPEPKEGLFER